MVNDFSDEEFSFKGIAPGDREPAATDATLADERRGDTAGRHGRPPLPDA